MDHTVSYIVTDDTALTALKELENFRKVCLDLETTGLDSRIARPRLVQICDSSPKAESRVVYVFDLFKVSEDSTKKLLELIRCILRGV